MGPIHEIRLFRAIKVQCLQSACCCVCCQDIALPSSLLPPPSRGHTTSTAFYARSLSLARAFAFPLGARLLLLLSSMLHGVCVRSLFSYFHQKQSQNTIQRKHASTGPFDSRRSHVRRQFTISTSPSRACARTSLSPFQNPRCTNRLPLLRPLAPNHPRQPGQGCRVQRRSTRWALIIHQKENIEQRGERTHAHSSLPPLLTFHSR